MLKPAKTTAIATSNLAFVKYWGKKDEVLRLPTNASLSVSLSGMTTVTTVEFQPNLTADEITINGDLLDSLPASKAVKHLDRVRTLAGSQQYAKVVSQNSFPTGTGLSSSASGFAALSAAAAVAIGLNLSEKELSILARHGSGSACRSIPAGFVEWKDGDSSESSYSETLFPADYWDVSFVVAVVSDKPKHIPTSEGQETARTSPFFAPRLSHMNQKISDAKRFLKAKDFTALGELVEAEALELHAVMLTQKPALIYWTAGTISLMQLCQHWRENGEIEAYFSVNTGQDIYFMIRRADELKLTSMLQKTGIVKEVIVNHPGKGTVLSSEHLF